MRSGGTRMKKILVLSPIIISLLPLSGCGNSNKANISLYDADSRFVIQSFDNNGSISLKTYRNSQTGEVPYSELGEFFYANGGAAQVLTKTEKVNNIYQVSRDDGTVLLKVDPKADTFTVENYEHWSGFMKPNNGVGPDLASPDDSDEAAVHTSKKSKYIGEGTVETYNLKKYNFDIIEKDDKCYVPTQLLSSLYYRWMGNDLVYNGMDYYFAAVVRALIVPAINSSYYATNRRFLAAADTEATSYDPIGEETYRFAYQAKADDGTVSYRIISLTKDGKGKMLLANKPSEPGIDVTINGVDYTYNWEKKGDALYLETIATRDNPDTGEKESSSQGVSKIPLRDTFYGAKKRSKALAKFTYDLLKFQYDEFYGIKDVVGYSKFDEFVGKKGLKNRLLSQDSAIYDEALAEFTGTQLNDPHSTYGLNSIFSGGSPKVSEELSKKYTGTRYKSLLDKRTEYMDLRAKTMGITKEMDPNLAIGYFTKGNTAVIRFDSFSALGSFVSNVYEPEEKVQTDPRDAIKGGDIPLAFDASFDRISKDSTIKNVVIDITCNSGGMIMALPYIVAHFSKDPALSYKDVTTGRIKELHYDVDLNHDKVWGGEGDSYEGKYNFYILTSNFSFSCANFLPTIAKMKGVKVIGERSGGGAASVGTYSDGCGSIYNWSSPQICVYKKENEYIHNDAGIDVDYALASSSWYDLDKLDQFVSGLK